jgi:hypothetical protein
MCFLLSLNVYLELQRRTSGFPWGGVTALRSLLRSFELHAELRVLNAQRYPLSVELFVTLVLLDLTPNLADL